MEAVLWLVKDVYFLLTHPVDFIKFFQCFIFCQETREISNGIVLDLWIILSKAIASTIYDENNPPSCILQNCGNKIVCPSVDINIVMLVLT